MSELSDDSGPPVEGGGSFWEPGQYRRTTKRIEDGYRLCDDLCRLVTERAEIEKSYAKQLRGWSKKWNDAIDKGPEYGSAAGAWRSALLEADRRCQLHLHVRENLVNQVHNRVKQWQKDNYHRSVVQFREKKEMDDAFKKAQKPWLKLLQKVNKSKSEYYSACRAQRTASVQEKNASRDNQLSIEATKKLSERVQKATDEMQKNKERYQSALQDIDNYNGKYMEEMRGVFERCQEMEACRHVFFQQQLLVLQKCLNIADGPELDQIYSEFEETIRSSDKDRDLRWWSNHHGVNMSMNWPTFEEYTEEFRDINSRSNKKSYIADGSVTLIHQRSVCDDLPDYKTLSRLNSADTKAKSKSTNDLDQQAALKVNGASKNNRQMSGDSANPSTTNSNDSGGVAGEDCWDDDDDVSSVSPSVLQSEGIPVRALYDYKAIEDDELTFCAGDYLTKLSEEDEQGWCQGRFEGRVGLYPANYVELI